MKPEFIKKLTKQSENETSKYGMKVI